MQSCYAHPKKIGGPAVTIWNSFVFFQPLSSYKMGMLKKDVYRKEGHMS